VCVCVWDIADEVVLDNSRDTLCVCVCVCVCVYCMEEIVTALMVNTVKLVSTIINGLYIHNHFYWLSLAF